MPPLESGGLFYVILYRYFITFISIFVHFYEFMVDKSLKLRYHINEKMWLYQIKRFRFMKKQY